MFLSDIQFEKHAVSWQNTGKAERKLGFASFSLNTFSYSAASQQHVSKTG